MNGEQLSNADTEPVCPSEPTLNAFLDGTLDPALREVVVAHVDSCPRCERYCESHKAGHIERTRTVTPEEVAATQIRLSVDPVHPVPAAEASGRIGPYKILQPIGQGGMGQVFMAEQTEPVKRRVALKVIKSEAPTREILARFEAERQALALMDHQNIAKVLDAGITEQGRPYFAMELVNGVPITEYCDSNKLTPNDRLELFVQTCQAIQHAHVKGIVHRDIKPSNVLVTQFDGKPVAKVIDFGLAKALQGTNKLTDKTLFTQYGQIVGTLAYMSPEQAEINTLDIDTRTDVYSLGVILYELLTGSTPIPREKIRAEAFDRILAMIRETDPPRPSQRLSDSGEAVTGISDQRRTEPKRLSGILKGDLDWIIIKALEKDRNRRYETAAAFADDVRRFLDDEPVHATPPSRTYRLKKALRRNKKSVFGGIVVAGILLPVLVTVGWYWISESQAKAEVVKANRIEESIDKILKSSELPMPEILEAQSLARELGEFDNKRGQSQGDRLVNSVVDAATRTLEAPRIDDQIRGDVLEKAAWLRGVNSFAAEALEKRLGERLSKWHVVSDFKDVIDLHADGLQLKQTGAGLVSKMEPRPIGRPRAKIADKLPRSFRARVRLNLTNNAAVIVPGSGGDLEFRLESRTAGSFAAESIELAFGNTLRPECQVTKLWDTKVSGGLGVRRSLAISRDGRLLAVPDTRTGIAILDAKTGKQLHSIEALNDAGFALAFGDSSSATDFQLNLISLAPLRWSIAGKNGVGKTVQLAGLQSQYFDLHPTRELALAFDEGSLQCIPWNAPGDRKLARPDSSITSAIFSLDGSRVAFVTASHNVVLWSPDTGDQKILSSYPEPPGTIAFLSDNRSLLVSAPGHTQVFDVATGLVVKTWQRGAMFSTLIADTSRGVNWHLRAGGQPEILDAGLRSIGRWRSDSKIWPTQLVVSDSDSVYAVDTSEGRVIAGRTAMRAGGHPLAQSTLKETAAVILRGGLVLAERSVDVDQSGEVELICVQDRNGYEFQINDSPPVRIDAFARVDSSSRSMDLYLPDGTVMTDYVLESKVPPRRASDLERADLAFESQDYKEAADLYSSYSATDPDSLRECGFKEGLCRLLSGNRVVGKRLLDGVAGSGSDRWARHALAQLWLDALREGDSDSAEAFGTRLLEQFSFREVLPLLTQSDRQTVRTWVTSRMSALSTSDLLRYDPNRVARLGQDVQILEFLSNNGSDDVARRLLLHQRISLAKAMEFDGQDRGATAELETLVNEILSSPSADPSMITWATEEYSRCLRRLNDVGTARDLINRVDRLLKELPPGPHRQMMTLERARVRVADGRLSAAASGLEKMLRGTPANDHAFLSAHLMYGAVLSRLDDELKAKEAFSKGAKYVLELMETRGDRAWSAGDRLRALLILAKAGKLEPEILTASLTNLLTGRKSTANVMSRALNVFASPEQLSQAFSRSWADKEDEEFWRLAIDSASEPDRYRIPLVRFGKELSDITVFGGQASEAEKVQIQQLMEQGFESTIRRGEVKLSFAASVSIAWKTPLFGWRPLLRSMPKNEKLSSRICYVMAAKYHRTGATTQAREAARKTISLADDAELRKLAEKLLAEIGTK